MLTNSKIKWLGSIILAGILLVLAMMGGKWGTSYAADDNVNAAPIITAIIPSVIKVGSPDTVVIVVGSDFGNMGDTRVRLVGNGVDQIVEETLQVIPNGISIRIPAALLAGPNLYTLTVIKSSKNTIPTIPLWPPYDEVSNGITLTVYVPQLTYLPCIKR